MIVQADIEQKLTGALTPVYLEIVNESHMHSVPVNSETHFKVTAVAEAFSGKRKVARHQLVYGELKQELAGPVHALALHLYTPEEWAERQMLSPDSPNCLGGSKKDSGIDTPKNDSEADA
ncbi:DNA-binding transcriptional regulator BolA [BD1-7 clade bacterium]|uniref:DNA-binding transcriptional regulator BolA n=1 Tax=BD1-7 clade bacterium TaxID=2029982 RepID=A0A5S9QD18_9GAMM|nr:DNA-binding transcriptional regulator BolA [BD1-7 clade bacterium]CAA0115606.1 DNA-binding transcriptional regulator BolA [BD1-7 clade bacterium]